MKGFDCDGLSGHMLHIATTLQMWITAEKEYEERSAREEVSLDDLAYFQEELRYARDRVREFRGLARKSIPSFDARVME